MSIDFRKLLRERGVPDPADMIRPEIAALVQRGNVTSEELAELRCNSWEREALVPALDDKALIASIAFIRGRALLSESDTANRPEEA